MAGCQALRRQDERGDRIPPLPWRGFTLVELLVVIAIIGALVGMLLPAVFSAMERGRQVQCLNNIKQLGTAIVHYESTRREYPRNYGTPKKASEPTKDQSGLLSKGGSWMTQILPYIEELPLSDIIAPPGRQLDQADAQGKKDKAAGYDNLTAARTVVRTFVCPSARGEGKASDTAFDKGEFATTNYKSVAGCNWIVSVDPDTLQEKSDPVKWPKGRCANQTDGVDYGNGVICRGGRGVIPTVAADIRDGASKTFAIGESLVPYCKWSTWIWFEGTTATCGIPLNYPLRHWPAEVDRLQNADNWRYTYSFMSYHRGGANFAMCDSSGQFISEKIDLKVYQSLATIDGGENVSLQDAANTAF